MKEKKSPDLYESKIIKYNEITEIKVGEAMYKTIFPTDLTIQELTEMKKRDEDSIILKGNYSFGILLNMREKFQTSLPI